MPQIMPTGTDGVDVVTDLQVRAPEAPVGQRAPEATATAFDAVPAPAAVLDGNGRIVEVNRAWRLFAELNDGGPSCGVGADYLRTCDAADTPEAAAAAQGLRAVLGGGAAPYELEYPCDSPYERRWFLLQAGPLPHGAAAVVTHIDISRRKEMEERLRQLVDQDALTGLASRTALDRGLESLEPGGAVLVCDLDGFKGINDTWGHATGDALLVQVAARLRIAAADSLAGRRGGDEFVIVQPAPADHEQLLRRLRTSLVPAYQLGNRCIEVGCSVGMARRRAGELGLDVLARADAAMYAEKSARRARTEG